MSEAPYQFQPLGRAHLPLVGYWLSTPHVSAWWGDPDRELAEITAHLDDPAVSPYLVRHDGRPIGYIQAYDPFAEAAHHPFADQPPATIGIDQFIGKPELVGRGHGSAFIASFAAICFRAGVRRIVTDPDPANAAAVRAYVRAGFTPIGERSCAAGRVLLMAQDRKDQD